ncbi:conjugal transfer protein TraF [bacterium]|nr:MAG: conjugal transfer protein TraF [bacterium]
MMIRTYLSILLLLLVSFKKLSGYQLDERLVINESIASSIFTEQPHTEVFEKRADASNSSVVKIEGIQAYKTDILQASQTQPVILKIFSNKSSESQKMVPVYQKVADKFNTQIKFASMDLLSDQDTKKENYQIIFNLMAMLHIKQMNMPIFVFFFKGNLHLPAPIIQGFLTAENLEDQIKQRFLTPKNS